MICLFSDMLGLCSRPPRSHLLICCARVLCTCCEENAKSHESKREKEQHLARDMVNAIHNPWRKEVSSDGGC